MLKILFMGTPDFALESLKALYEAKYNIVGVVTNPDRPKGRGMKMIASPVKEYALEKHLEVYQPEKVRNNEEFLNTVKKINPDLICVVAYGKILPKELLEIPKMGCINVHGSLLPQYRGAAPIQWAVLNGDKKTGITTMYMNEGMDTGDMILKEEVQIGKNETTGELWERLSKIGAKLLVETVEKIEDGTAPREKQPEDFTMAPMLHKEMANIDWDKKDATQIKNLVRGLNPIMGAYTYLNGKKIKFWKVEKLTTEELAQKYNEMNEYMDYIKKVQPGTVLFSNVKQGLYIKCNNDIISVIEIQGENSRKMNILDFLRGNPINAGEIFQNL
ncbi:MAG: methionyl-tRNA formyltransferase [Christensenellales bacterium]